MITAAALANLIRERRGSAPARNVEELASRIRGRMHERSYRDMPGEGVSKDQLSAIAGAVSSTKDFLRALEKAKDTGEVDGRAIEAMQRAVRQAKDLGRSSYGL